MILHFGLTIKSQISSGIIDICKHFLVGNKHRGSIYVLFIFIHYLKNTHRIPHLSPGLIFGGLIFGRIFGFVYRGPIYKGAYNCDSTVYIQPYLQSLMHPNKKLKECHICPMSHNMKTPELSTNVRSAIHGTLF